MSRTKDHQALALLRANTYRLSATPTRYMPKVAPRIASSLWQCKDILSSSRGPGKTSNDASQLVHRLKTNITSLLQDKTVEGRYAAVILCKAIIEAGGFTILGGANVYVRSLLAILKKPLDPPTTRVLAVITLTRIFMLTWDDSNLVREITTPALPTYVGSCLGNLDRSSTSTREREMILESFALLIPRHRTIFRTFEQQIRTSLLHAVSSTSSDTLADIHFSGECIRLAEKVLVLLHFCAPKQGGAEKWDESFKATVAAAHTTCDRIFRSVVEAWSSTTAVRLPRTGSTIVTGELELGGQDTAGLENWRGMISGSERLICLLDMLREHLDTPSSGTVPIRVGLLVDLMTRVMGLSGNMADYNGKVNQQVSQDERENLFLALPSIHVAALRLGNAIFVRFGASSFPLIRTLLDLVIRVFQDESAYPDIRRFTYCTLKTILELVGPSMRREEGVDLAGIAKWCCEDLEPSSVPEAVASSTTAKAIRQSLTKEDAANGTSVKNLSRPTDEDELQVAASTLLPVLLRRIEAGDMPRKVRVQMERTAILSSHKDALVACVLNPPRKDLGGSHQPSLLPFLARMFPESPEMEAILRPRMPVIMTKAEKGGVDEDEVSDELGDEVQSETSAAVLDYNYSSNGSRLASSLIHTAETGDQGSRDHDNTSDLYASTVAPVQVKEVTNDPLSAELSLKRPFADQEDHSASAKRLQASSVAAALVPDSHRGLPGPDPETAAALVPVTTLPDPSTTAYEPPITLPSVDKSTTKPLNTAEVDSDDGSDFELPPLTLDPDTESEEDEVEEAEV